MASFMQYLECNRAILIFTFKHEPKSSSTNIVMIDPNGDSCYEQGPWHDWRLRYHLEH